jgi:hypothetical protein
MKAGPQGFPDAATVPIVNQGAMPVRLQEFVMFASACAWL